MTQEQRSRQDELGCEAAWPAAGPQMLPAHPWYLSLHVSQPVGLGRGLVQEAGAQLQHGGRLVLDHVLPCLRQLRPQVRLDVPFQLWEDRGRGHGQGRGGGGGKAPAPSYVSTKDIEQPGETSLPCQATITSRLDDSSSSLPGFSASTLVPLCLVHPPLSSQRDPVQLSQITCSLRSNLSQVPSLLTGKAEACSLPHDLASRRHSDFSL